MQFASLLLLLIAVSATAQQPLFTENCDSLRFIDFQYLHSHNSYRQRGQVYIPQLAYSHPSLDVQLNNGIRWLELDFEFRQNFRVVHVPLIDEGTSCADMASCLAIINNWMDANVGIQEKVWGCNWHQGVGHLPVVLRMEKKENSYYEKRDVWTNVTQSLIDLDTLIKNTFGNKLYTIQEAQTKSPNGLKWLDQQVRMGKLRGKVIILWESLLDIVFNDAYPFVAFPAASRIYRHRPDVWFVNEDPGVPKSTIDSYRADGIATRAFSSDLLQDPDWIRFEASPETPPEVAGLYPLYAHTSDLTTIYPTKPLDFFTGDRLYRNTDVNNDGNLTIVPEFKDLNVEVAALDPNGLIWLGTKAATEDFLSTLGLSYFTNALDADQYFPFIPKYGLGSFLFTNVLAEANALPGFNANRNQFKIDAVKTIENGCNAWGVDYFNISWYRNFLKMDTVNPDAFVFDLVPNNDNIFYHARVVGIPGPIPLTTPSPSGSSAGAAAAATAGAANGQSITIDTCKTLPAYVSFIFGMTSLALGGFIGACAVKSGKCDSHKSKSSNFKSSSEMLEATIEVEETQENNNGTAQKADAL